MDKRTLNEKLKTKILPISLCMMMLTGCGSTAPAAVSVVDGKDGTGIINGETIEDGETPTGVSNEVEVTKGARSGNVDGTPIVKTCEASGETVYECDSAVIDASHPDQGYCMVKYFGSCDKVRVVIDTPQGNRYNYLCPMDGEYHSYPFSEGSGTYNIVVCENVSGTQYATVLGQSIDVSLESDEIGYLYPNIYVEFDANTKALAKGADLAKGAEDDLTVVSRVYHYVSENVKYDYDLAKNVGTDYQPVVDNTFDSCKGICFDYASLMAAMLRSQGIPTRLEIGYAKEQYHAWIGVYLSDIGWVDGLISFDGVDWTMMDPTLKSTGKASVVEDYMNNKSNYYKIVFKY